MCPHAAGKSVIAATYFRQAAAKLGLDATARVAGTDPDEAVMDNVRQALKGQGFAIEFQPSLVTSADTAAADLIVSIGCDLAEIPTDKRIVEWDVPMLSEDLHGSMAAIHDRVEALAAELAAR
jgi:protein-tyrosine-phosphatase